MPLDYTAPARIAVSPGKLLIGGTWRDAADGAKMTTTDPATEEVITEIASASLADADAAVQAAARALAMVPGPVCATRNRQKPCCEWPTCSTPV